MVKQLNNIEKAVMAKEKELIQCQICKKKRMMHKFSYCWKYELCIVCTNREMQHDEILGRE